MRRFLLTAATAATALVGTACGDVTGIGAGIAGTYQLRTVNDLSLPVSDQFGEILEAGELELDSNGEFILILQIRPSPNSLIQTIERFGTWDRNGDEIRLEFDDSSDVWFAERTSSSRITVEDDVGNVYVFQRF
jgi:hypothetical protein